MKDSFDEFYSDEEALVNQPLPSSPPKSSELKQPKSPQEYIQFLNSVIDQAESCSSQLLNRYLEVMLGSNDDIQEFIRQNQITIEQILHICIVRADVDFERFMTVLSSHSTQLNLIPILVWTLHSKKSKRYLESVCVKLFESFISKYNKKVQDLPFARLCTSVRDPPILPDKRGKGEKGMQASLNVCILQAFLHSLSNLAQEYNELCKTALRAVYKYAIQEVEVPIIFIAEQLLDLI